jgi:hypothetical protein
MKSVRTVLAVCVLLAVVGPLVAAGSYPAANRQYAGAAPGPAPKGTPPMTDDSLWIKADSVNIGTPGSGGWNGTKVYGDTIYQINSTSTNYIVWKLDRLTGASYGSFTSPSTEYAMGIAVVDDSIYVSVFYPADQFDVYTRSGTYVRTFAAPSGRMCRGLDWDGSQFWVADNNTTLPSIYTMDRAGTVLKTFTNTGSPAAYWIFDLAFDRMIPNRLWLNDQTSPGVTNYCSFDTSANTYTVLAAFTHPASPDYPEGIGFWGPELGAGYVYTVGVLGPWVYKMQVHAAEGYKVMLVESDDADSQYVWQLATLLRDSSNGQFSVVDTYSIQSNAAFPAAQWYSDGYRAIFAYTNFPPADSILVGDSLAAFIEDGGGVVDAIAAMISPFGFSGRYRSQYSPFTNQTTYSGSDTMSLVHDPSHPIMAGVTSFGYTGSLGSNNAHGNLRGANSVCLAEYSHGNRCVAACFDSGGHRAASLGIFPMWHWTGYPNIGQWVRLYVNAVEWVAAPLTGIEEPKPATELARFRVAGSNPFRSRALLSYSLPGESRVSLKVYSAAGRLVRTLAETNQSPGLHQAVWDGRDDLGRVSGHGVYYCRLQAGALGATTKLVKVE